MALRPTRKIQETEPQQGTPQKAKAYYVCPMHPQQAYEKPGECAPCNGMKLEELVVPPGAKLVYACPEHPDEFSEAPGKCPKPDCGKALQYRVKSANSRISQGWICPSHPDAVSSAAAKCKACGSDTVSTEFEEFLAVPFDAVIDTGSHSVVFLKRPHDTFEAVEIVLGLRAGEYYPVRKGLNVGDEVVTSGAFLLDAEARLNPAAGVVYFGASGSEKKP